MISEVSISGVQSFAPRPGLGRGGASGGRPAPRCAAGGLNDDDDDNDDKHNNDSDNDDNDNCIHGNGNDNDNDVVKTNNNNNNNNETNNNTKINDKTTEALPAAQLRTSLPPASLASVPAPTRGYITSMLLCIYIYIYIYKHGPRRSKN